MNSYHKENSDIDIPAGAYGSLALVFMGVILIMFLYVSNNIIKPYAVLSLICLVIVALFTIFYLIDFNRTKREEEAVNNLRLEAENAVEKEINFILSVLSFAKEKNEYYESHYKKNICILNKDNAKHLLTFRAIIDGLENRITALKEHLNHENPKMCNIVFDIIKSPLEFNNSKIYTLIDDNLVALEKDDWERKVKELISILDCVHKEYDRQAA